MKLEENKIFLFTSHTTAAWT